MGPGWDKHAMVSWPTQQPALEGWGGTIWSRGRANPVYIFQLRTGSGLLHAIAFCDCNY